jgi:aminoglycoside phosphotransferase family enzyme/predicted kinase
MSALKEDLQGLGFEFIETHISWVFLKQSGVWKVKKPVNLGFLDFSSLEKRRAACDAEVELNQRLAPGIYRGVVAVTRDAEGTHQFGGEGEVVDWAVEMVRLDDSRRADLLLQHGALEVATVEHLAERIARFHADMPTNSTISACGEPDSILANVRQNFEQTRNTISKYLDSAQAREIEAKQLGFIEQQRELLKHRTLSGRIRDGHGDLRLEHIYLTGREPTIIDCIEFNAQLRYEDVCADIAFLSMDLERLGRVDLAERFLAVYARTSGDYELYRLVDFYQGYRAYVRAKVASMLAADAGAGSAVRERAAEQARRYYVLALSAGRESVLRPALIVVGGIIGSGKSTVSELIASMLGAPVISADRTRKLLVGVRPTQPLHDAAWSGAYSSEVTRQVYAELLGSASHVLASGRPVILDASFRSRDQRSAALSLAQQAGVRFFFVETRASDRVCRERIAKRSSESSVSDGRVDIYEDFVAQWQAVDELDPTQHVVLDSTRSLQENERTLREILPTWPPGLNQ